MLSRKQNFRWLATRLPPADKHRLVVLTGARQTGKTTLARRLYRDLRYVNLDAIEEREALRGLRSGSWGRAVGPAVIDEAQKEPGVFDKVKLAYDEQQIAFSVLLGSSRVLLLDRVRESLAGRAFVYDLWPLMASEVRCPAETPPKRPLFDRLVTAPQEFAKTLGAEPPRLLGDDATRRFEALDHLANWGGMPELLSLDDGDRREWLRSYQQTWLERDLADLTRVSDLLPFRALQRLAMLRTGQLLNYADFARDAAVSAGTARRYLEYLRLSYQVVLLQPYARNLTSSTVKTPKLYWMDLGLLRHGTRNWGELTGPLFETLVVSEARKWIDTLGRDVSLHFYRTRSGREVDLLIDAGSGIIGIEIKNRVRVSRTDCTGLRALAKTLGDEWAGGLVVHRGEALEELGPGFWAVPAYRLF
ncbi:MAG: ATP-binding protein [Acidobacteria bacterium]|nr:ATP-binding protein [Acidobacteriota bacterium]MYH31743.1 ATP-binding protein [Acidobacteriota bacterium]MYK88631.1 ATP-binding protein [Acidobacteriota bacterium]